MQKIKNFILTFLKRVIRIIKRLMPTFLKQVIRKIGRLIFTLPKKVIKKIGELIFILPKKVIGEIGGLIFTLLKKVIGKIGELILTFPKNMIKKTRGLILNFLQKTKGKIKNLFFVFLNKTWNFFLDYEPAHAFIHRNLKRAAEILNFLQSTYKHRLFINGTVQEFQLTSFKNFSKNAKIIMEINPQEIPTVVPQFYNKAIFCAENRMIKLPTIFVGQVAHVEILSNTDILINKNNLYSDLLHHVDGYRHGVKLIQEFLFGFFGQTLALNLSSLECGSIKKGIHFLCDYSFNYFHWIFECLPRYYLLDKINLPLDYPLLVDKWIAPQHIEALRLIVGKKRPIILLDPLQRYHVNDLIYPSFLSVCNDHKEYTQSQPEDFVISPTAIEFVQTKMLSHVLHHFKPNRKIYICRNENRGRHLLNKQQLIPQLMALGFELVFPEKLSIMEQMILFQQTEIILCETGAAMANMIFCQPNTQIIVLVAETKNANYYFFSQIAEHCQLKLTYFMGIAENSFDMHSAFVIDIPALMKIVKEI